MDKQYLPPIENVSVQRGFKHFNPGKGGSNLQENQTDFAKFPYSSIGYLHFRDKSTNKKKIIGQGVLIGPTHILTTARNVYNFTQQEDNILDQGDLEFYCGFDLDIQAKVVAIYCNSAAISQAKSYDQQDFAVCVLSKDIGEKQGFFGVITPLQMAFFEEIQFKQQQVFVFDSQQVLSGQICDVDTKEMLIQFKNQEGEVMNNIDQELNSLQEDSLERELDLKYADPLGDEETEKVKEEKGDNSKVKPSQSAIFNKIVYIFDKIFGYVVLSADAQRDGLYYKSQFLTNFHLYQMVFWFQGVEISAKDQVNKMIEMKFLENKGNMKVEEPAEQENKAIMCLKQLNNQFIFTGNDDSSANFWHLGSMNIGQSVQREIFEYNFRDGSFNGIIDIVSEGYYSIALVGRYAILLNWLNFELLEAKEFDYDLTCIHKRAQRFKYFVGDSQGSVLYLKLNCDTLQLEEDPEGSIRSKLQRNMHGHEKPVEQLHFIKEKNQLVVATQDGIRLWDVKSKKLVANIEAEQKKPITFVGYSKARLYIAGEDQYLRIYDLSGKQYRSMRFQFPIKCGVFLNSAELALSDGKNLKIINVISNDQDYYSVHKYNITHICRISDFQFVTADTKGSLYKWTLMMTESDPSLQYRVALELSNKTQSHCSNFSPERITKFFSSNLSPQRTSFHSQKLQQMKAKIDAQRSLANQGIYEGSSKMVGDLYQQENYYLKAKVKNLEGKVHNSRGGDNTEVGQRDFLQNSSFSRQNLSISNISASGKSTKDNSSGVALKTYKAQIKVMEQKLKEQEDLVIKIQEEEQVLRNNAEKKVKQEKKSYMERNVDDIKLNSQRFESKIPLIQNDIDLLRKQLNLMNERLSDRQDRIRDRSSSLQQKQSELQQFHNEVQKRDQNVQEELNKKRERTKQIQEQGKKELEIQKLQNTQRKSQLKQDEDYFAQSQGQEEDEENQSVHDDQIDQISQELDQTIKNSQNYINSQRNLNSSLQNRPQTAADDSNDSNLKGSQVSSRTMNYRNDEINNSTGSSCVLNNKKMTSSTQARNIMKSNRDEQKNGGYQDNSQNSKNNLRGSGNNNDISDIEEEQESYKYTNRKSSPSNYGNSNMHLENSDREQKLNLKSAFNIQDGGDQLQESLKYSFIEGQFLKLQSQVKSLQQNFEELKQQSMSPQRSQLNQIPPQQILVMDQPHIKRTSDFKPILRIQQSPASLTSTSFANTSNSPTQLQSAQRLNNFIGQSQVVQQSKLLSSPPSAQYAPGVVRSVSPNVIVNTSTGTYNNSQLISSNIYQGNGNNSPALMNNTTTSFYVNNSPQKSSYSQVVQKSQNTQSPGQILLLNNSLNQSQCEGLTPNTAKQNPNMVQQLVGSQQKQSRPSSQLSQVSQKHPAQDGMVQNNQQFNYFKQNSSLSQNSQISAQQQQQPVINNSMNSFTQQSFDFIQQQKLLLAQQQQQLKYSQNRMSASFAQNQQPGQGQEEIQEQEIYLAQERKLSSNLANRSTKSAMNDDLTNMKYLQLEQENDQIKKQLFDQQLLLQEMQALLDQQKDELAKRDQMLNQERENASLQQQKFIDQCGIYDQNVQKLSTQVIQQNEIIKQLEQEKLSHNQSYNEMIKQIDRDKNQLLNQINQFDQEIQQKNSDLIQNKNSMTQMNVTLSQMRQLTTYEEVEKLTKQITGLEKMLEQSQNESKSQKQLLLNQEKMIVDGKRLEGDFQQVTLQKQQLVNENDILKSRSQILENENKRIHQKMLTIREEIDGKYQQAIIELQKLMQGHTNKQINLSQSINNLQTGVLTGMDINALDKLIEISNKKQQSSSTQNLKQSSYVSSIPISQIQGQQQQKSSSNTAIRFSEQGSYNDYVVQKGQTQKYTQMANMESTSSIRTFNPDDQSRMEDFAQAQGRQQSRSVSPLGLVNRMNSYNSSSQAKILKSDRSQHRFDSGSIRTFRPDGEQPSVDNESDYYSNFSNAQQIQDNQQMYKKSQFKQTQKSTGKDYNNQKQVVLVDEFDNKKQKEDEQGMCSQQ